MLLGNCKQVNKKKAKKPVVGEEQVDTEKIDESPTKN